MPKQLKPLSQRIFVAIASYRDNECTNTLADMFAKAAKPERIFAGVCLQLDPKTDADCAVTTNRPKQVRLQQIHHTLSKGANWARGEAIRLRKDEEYVLLIDSHMRFEPGWDEAFIDMLARCPADKPIISAYLPKYELPDKRDRRTDDKLRICVRGLGEANDPQLLHLTAQSVLLSDRRSGLYPTPFVIFNCIFAKASLFDEVPIDPHFQFYGDEISFAARLWTHGYDIFQPDRLVMYHRWARQETMHLQHYRGLNTPQSRQSLARVRHLLGFETAKQLEDIAQIAQYGLGNARPLAGLWEIAGIDWQAHTVNESALEGHWNMAAGRKKSKGKSVAKPKAARKAPRIFVQIASYRDPDCQHTVKDLFDKAAHPERIFVGICWQSVKKEDKACFEVPYPRPKQVRVLDIDAKKSQGVCWARGLTQGLWEGEEFTLQIDSHMRFEPGWDETLLSMWAECENPKAVLTCYPPGFTPPADFQREFIFGMSAKEFDKHGIFLMKGAPAFKQGQFPPKPIVGAYLSGCMYFGPAGMIADVPYDPHLYFFGEEITMAVRLWTHGYDFYHPNKMFIFHDWDRSKRPTHFSDNKDWTKQNDRSVARVKHLLKAELSADKKIVAELDKYGLGTVRSLEEYQEYSGVDFAKKTFNLIATKGSYAPYQPTKIKSEQPRIFVQIASYRDTECQWTVKDLFDKAAYPDRIFVGICWQFDEAEDQDCFQISTRPDQVRVYPVDWRESDGVCWARHQTQLLWEGEEYTLQIDAHMRFVQGWDELLIAELNACDAPKPVLSCSPAAYRPPNQLEVDPRPTVRRVMPFFRDGNIRGKGELLERVPPKPLNAAFVAAGFVFSRAEIIAEVPYDPYLYFDQEEICYAARLYTHGWDVFSSRKPLLYHYYNMDPGKTVRPLHWRDLREKHGDKIRRLHDRGLKRFNHLFGHTPSRDSDIILEMEKYGFGAVRMLADFEAYCGIDFKRKIASERALRCEFIKDLKLYRDRPIDIDATPENTGQPMLPAATPMRMLEPGDFAPLIEALDTQGSKRGLEVYGGKHAMLFFLPAADMAYMAAFFPLLHQLTTQQRLDVWQIFIVDAPVAALAAIKEKLKIPHLLWADPERKIARAFGVAQAPAAFLLNNNLRIIHSYRPQLPAQLVQAVVNDCRDALTDHQIKTRDAAVISEIAPVLIVPDVFSQELCDRCIAAFRSGRTFDGTVGAEASLAYRPNAKTRTDHVVEAALRDVIDEKLSRALFPEIEKVFGVAITHRENYKVGLYTGEKGGFFRQHRDNFDAPLGYRRIALTIHLSDDYEGGGLRFPEYDEHVYRPAKGSAIAFSCSTLHEARPVVKGDRFIVVGFLHGPQEEAFRKHYQASQNLPLKTHEYIPKLWDFGDAPRGRDFYRNWQAQQVSYEGASSSAPALRLKPSLTSCSLRVTGTGRRKYSNRGSR
jgi:peroxiredoxin/predicted 2-oxoglutarate/Fe(II)-dependent dioxygenase YbiX/glycosyltransferase involved in cell wall biosynthesis